MGRKKLKARQSADVTRPGTFYRAIYDQDEISKTVLNQPPPFTSNKAGDFAPAGWPVYYMWEEENLAEIWCDTRDKVRYPICYIVQLFWRPPSDLKVKKFPANGNDEYVNVRDINTGSCSVIR